MKKKAISLLELMVAVSILAIGISYVLRSFIGSASALSYYENRRHALLFLENKMSLIEQSVFGKTYSDILLNRQENVLLRGVIDARFVYQINEVEHPVYEEKEQIDDSLKLYNLTLKLIWPGKGTENIQQLHTAVVVETDLIEAFDDQ